RVSWVWPAILRPQRARSPTQPSFAKATEATILRPPLALRAKDGGAEGVRTPDLLNAIQALYQLSYDPIRSSKKCKVLKTIVKTKYLDLKNFAFSFGWGVRVCRKLQF